MDFSLVGLWNQMGWVARGVVIILLIMSMYSIGITVERFLTFRKGRLQSIGYIGALQPLVATTGRLREAVGLEQRFRGSPVAKVIGTGIRRIRQRCRSPGAQGDRSGRAGDRGRQRQPHRWSGSRSASWPTCAAVFPCWRRSPRRRRSSVCSAPCSASSPPSSRWPIPSKGGGGLASVSAGIAEALLTTAVGLAVAIVAVWFYNIFINKVDDVTVDVDETTGEVLDSMTREGRAFAGARGCGRARQPGATPSRSRRSAGSRRAAAPQPGTDYDGQIPWRSATHYRQRKIRQALRQGKKHAKGKLKGDINVTPLVDVVLVLLDHLHGGDADDHQRRAGGPAAHREPLEEARRRQGHHRRGGPQQGGLHQPAAGRA